MSKRFTDTDKWDDPWYMELPVKYKLFWVFMLDNCSPAGIYKINIRLASFQIGEPFEESEIKRVFAERIFEIAPGKWFVKKFIKYQYGTLSENCKPHQPIIKELRNYENIEDIRVFLPLRTRQEQYKDQDKEKEGASKNGKTDKKTIMFREWLRYRAEYGNYGDGYIDMQTNPTKKEKEILISLFQITNGNIALFRAKVHMFLLSNDEYAVKRQHPMWLLEHKWSEIELTDDAIKVIKNYGKVQK